MGVQPEVYIGNGSVVLVIVVNQRDGRSLECEVSQHGKGWFEILWMSFCFHMFSMFSQKHPVQEPRITPASAASALCPKAEEIVLHKKFERPFKGYRRPAGRHCLQYRGR